MSRTYLSRGSYNVICDRCGKKLKSHEVSKEWTGLIVCRSCIDERHPQDFVRGVRDRMTVPFSRPRPPADYVLDYSITGSLLLPLGVGPEENWDEGNAVTVQLTSGSLSSASELAVLNGANMAAVEQSSGVWEIIQFQNATQLDSTTWHLTRLLRARVGTERAMGASAGARFAFMGQSSASTYAAMIPNLGIGNLPFSPINITAQTSGSDITINWTRRTRAVRLDQDDYFAGGAATIAELGGDFISALGAFAFGESDALPTVMLGLVPDPLPYVDCPLGETEEKYGVDIIGPDSSVIRTIYSIASTSASYTGANQIADFGAIQPTYNIRVYQISPEYGNGTYREAIIP